MTGSCALCHRVSGTPAQGTLGPDLTHIGSRTTLGAGALENTPEHLARWIADPQNAKPGVRMPPQPLNPDEIQALVAYLDNLQ